MCELHNHLATSLLTRSVDASKQFDAATQANMIAIAQEYRQVVEACYHVPTCVGVTVWGVCDAANQGKTLFKTNCDPTDSYYAIADWLKTLQK